MPIYNNALAQRPANMLAYEDTLRATPRNEYLGALADFLAQSYAPERTQQMQGVAQFLGVPAIRNTLNMMAYGDPLTTGAGMTTRVKPDVLEAGMAVAPVAKPATMASLQAARAARQAALVGGRVMGQEMAARMLSGQSTIPGLPVSIAPPPVKFAVELGSEFLGKRPPKIENLAKSSDKFLFHSSTADKAKDLRYGVEPQAGGPWVREVASGATDENLDDFFENVTPLAWFSDKPEWIKAMVGRKIDKPFDKVTAKDIEEHGHLAFINKKSPEAENITYIPSEGLMEGGQSKVFDIQGNPKKAWETGLYQEGRYGRQMEPFGIERNEYVSPESVEPLLQLTGPELVQFMRLKGLLPNEPVNALLKKSPPEAAGSVNFLKPAEYRGSHTAPGPDFGAPLYDLTGGGQMYPADVYSAKAAQYYGTGYPKADREAFALAQRVRGNPDAEIIMYRAVPKDEKITAINPGDWVTLSKDYAKTHGEAVLDNNYKILSQKVKAKDLWTNADSIHEFGYQPQTQNP